MVAMEGEKSVEVGAGVCGVHLVDCCVYFLVLSAVGNWQLFVAAVDFGILLCQIDKFFVVADFWLVVEWTWWFDCGDYFG